MSTLTRLALSILLVAAPMLSAGSTVEAQARKLLPADDGAKDPAFFSFRAGLFGAVASRNVEALLEALAPDVLSEVGETHGPGVERFRTVYELDRLDSPFWREFGAVLALGGRFETPERFSAPYVSTDWPPEVDESDHAAIVGDNVRVRYTPALEAPVVGTVSFDIVQLSAGYREQAPWTAIVFRGRPAFVATRFIRVAAGFRAMFTRVDGKWLVAYFLAGD